MSDDWLLTMKPAFLNQLVALPAKEVAQVNKKLSLLTEDPTPDAKVKKKLKHVGFDLYRLRSGDYRVFYTFEAPYISVLALARRNDETYDAMPAPELLGGLDPEAGTAANAAWTRWIETPAPAQATPLPAPITPDLLTNLRVPETFHARLCALTTEESLFAAEDVPDEHRLRVHDALTRRPLDAILQEPDLVAHDVDDLLRFKEGELLGFLLKLNPEQEKYVKFSLRGKGPTLLKGGPGTGKSTVALYRAQAMVAALKKRGNKAPRLLFTTYTRALIHFSRQLLERLLGDDARFVEVQTADALARKITDGRLPPGADLMGDDGFRAVVKDTLKSLRLDGPPLVVKAQEATLAKLGPTYLAEELLHVIQAQGLGSLEAYQATARPGRLQRLSQTGRTAVWALHQRTQTILRERSFVTWPELRQTALETVQAGHGPTPYDGVIVDEAQDLDPAALRLLVALCQSPGRLFLTADANQSIYGAGFRWKDVHEDLSFVGRTGVLKANHRSTRELGEAARSYLQDGTLDDAPAPQYINNGPEPAVRAVAGPEDQVRLLQRFLPAAARELRLGLKGCAVLTPSKKEGDALAEDLKALGVEASFMTSQDLDLNRPGVKVLPLQAAKGLEFPVVALAGFLDGAYPYVSLKDPPDVQAEALKKARRTLFVAMTRAMRALLVILPESTTSPVFAGFADDLWNRGAS